MASPGVIPAMPARAGKLDPRALSVFTALVQHCEQGGGECQKSIRELAQERKMSENTVRLAIRRIERAGLINIRRKRDQGGASLANVYVLR